MKIKKINESFCVCKVSDFSCINLEDDFVFVGKTDEEKSIVCSERSVPNNLIECERGWKAFRIQGVLDFSLIGILAKIATILAEKDISIYAISTFNTDYILVKEEKYTKAIEVLSQNGYQIED